MLGTNLVDIPLENRERSSPLKKLCTAVSLESPDLFRIRGVPCIDRGPDKSRPPIAYEHWNGNGSLYERESGGDGIKETANFARLSSVSADTPNFFKVPGVAINKSSAITGADAVCSPPPQHLPFSLPGTYMHGKEAKAVADPKILPGRWRETDREVGQWGHATREFHEALVKMRNEGAARRDQQEPPSASQANRLRGATPSAATPQERPRDADGKSTPLPRQRRLAPGAENREGAPVLGSEKTRDSGELHGERKGGWVSREEGGGRRRRASAVEVFMSRLEGERGPQNRRESIAAFRKLLKGCPTNNSVQFADDAVVAGASRAKGTAGVANRNEAKGGSALCRVLARRKAAHSTVAGIMGKEGSYMLGRDADASKIFLGRTQDQGKPSSVGVVRVSSAKM